MKAMIFRFTNGAILGMLVVLILTGTYSLFPVGAGWIVDIHRIAAWVLVALIPWKVGISWRSLKRGFGARIDRNIIIIVSLSLATLAILILFLAFTWTWQIGPQTWFRQYALWWHWMLAYVLIVPLAVHVWRRWPRPKKVDFTSRRSMLRMVTYGAFGLVSWRLAEVLAEARASVDSPRLITGSRRIGEFTGNDFPITSEPSPTINAAAWQMNINGAVSVPLTLTLDALLAHVQTEYDATLDCTNGWWTTQHWRGVSLSDLLQKAGMRSDALAIRITSVTNYYQVFTMKEARQILIATHVGGEPLSHLHGAPARAVVPSRRGWFWVKWLSEVKVLDTIDEIVAHPITIR